MRRSTTVSARSWRLHRPVTRALAIALAWLALPASALAQDVAGGRAALEAFSTDLQAYSARFSQAVIGTDGELLEEGEGEVMLATPDHFRWRYEGDFPELIVADGERVWQFDEALNQVTVRAQSSMAGDNPLQLLTDISALDASFQLVELGTINDLAYLELTALDVDAQFERMVLAFGDGALERLILEDAFGMRTEMRFQDGVRNPPLAADLFRFAPPPGVDVVGEWPAAETP